MVVLWPVVVMFRTSFQHFSPNGFLLGSAGWKNFKDLFDEPDLPGILWRTAIWVVVVVIVTMLLSLGLAQLFNQVFPGRRVTRWALIAPWAASVLMTTLIFRWALDPNSGVINLFLKDVGVLKSFGSNQADWLGRPQAAFVWMMVVAIFVSLPFTTYALLAGLQTIPTELYEAARVDGAIYLADIPLDHASAAAAGVPRRRADQCDQRLQLVPDHLGDDPWRTGARDRYHHGVHVPAQGGLHRRVGGDVGDQLWAGHRRRAGVPVGDPLAGAGDLAMTDVVTEQPLTGVPGRRARRVRRVPRGKKLIFAGLAYLIAIIFLLPYAEMVITALRPNDELLDRDYVPRHWTFSNFTSIWASGFGTNLKISLEVAGGATALVLLVALPAAYYTARRHFPGRGLFLLLVLVTQMLQPAAMLVGIQREFLNFDLPSAVLSLILVNAGFNLAFAVWILNAYFSSVPVELEEAAMVDGAGRLGALGRITLPLAMPGIVTALIFTFIAAWNEFIVALTLATSPDEFPAHGRDQQLCRPVLGGLGTLVRGLGDRDHSRDHPVRLYRGKGCRRPYGRLHQVVRSRIGRTPTHVVRRGRDRVTARQLAPGGKACAHPRGGKRSPAPRCPSRDRRVRHVAVHGAVVRGAARECWPR